MLRTMDQLLNSKNEYIQNYISRITIQEESFERKKRILLEEAEEKKEEADLEAFKATKRATTTKRRMNEDLEGNLNKKRKISIHMEEEVTGREDRADPPEKEVDNVVVLVDDVADPPPMGEVGFEAPEEGIITMGDPHITESGREKLKELRKQMEA